MQENLVTSKICGEPYPASEKLLAIVRILSDVLGIVVKYKRLLEELRTIDARWTPHAIVPFRDATIKNMVLAAPELWLGKYESEAQR